MMGRCEDTNLVFCSMLVLGFLMLLPHGIWAETFYVTPSPSVPCPEPCRTLSEYADQPPYDVPNITMFFLEGEHFLTRNLSLSDINNLVLTSVVLNSDVLINCSRDGKFLFVGIENILINGIRMAGCYGNRITSVNHASIESTHVQGISVNSTEAAFYLNGTQEFEVVNSTFISNEVVMINETGCSVFHVTNSNMKIFSSVFDNNVAGADNYKFSTTICVLSSNVTMADSNFTHNSGYSGGVMYAGDSRVMAVNSLFSNNHVTSFGGVILLIRSSLALDDCVFIDNDSSERGGVMDVEENSEVTALRSVFAHNHAANFGGVFFMLNKATLNLDNCAFSDNTCDYLGGAVYSENLGTIRAFGTAFSRNYAAYFGGAAYIISKSDLTVENCTFSENSCGSTAGVMHVSRDSNIKAVLTRFEYNFAPLHSGEVGVMWLSESSATFEDSTFIGNRANNSATLSVVHDSKLNITNCSFLNNIANSTDSEKGAAAVLNIGFCHSIYIRESKFINNFARSGGCGFVRDSTLHIADSCLFEGNSAEYGGAFTIWDSILHINSQSDIDDFSQVMFHNNSAHFGGALNIIESSVAHIHHSIFEDNAAKYVNFEPADHEYRGGAILVRSNSSISLLDTSFSANIAEGKGGMIFLQFANIEVSGLLTADHNKAENGALYMTSSVAWFTGTLEFSNNKQSLFAHNCHIYFTGQGESMFYGGHSFNEEGGALTAIRSTIYASNISLWNNSGENGGGIYMSESVLNIQGECTFLGNLARTSGGALYAYKSEVNISGDTTVRDNEAKINGGGMFLGRSALHYRSHFITISNNKATLRGGAIYFDQTSVLLIIKEQMECSNNTKPLWYCIYYEWLLFTISGNSAELGGAIYVNDDSATSCDSEPYDPDNTFSECFIQTVAAYERAYDWNTSTANYANIIFTNNTANNGSLLYGGLLDRCAIDQFAELRQNETIPHPLEYFKTLSRTDISDTELASKPVQACFCDDDLQIDCSKKVHQLENIQRGETFSLKLAVVDQVETPVGSYIRAYLSSVSSRLRDGESIQWTDGCTELMYSVYSTESEVLTLYPDGGPCTDSGISKVEVNVTVDENCPLGFALSNTSLECECDHDPKFRKHISECYIDTESVLRQGNFWISSILNDTDNNTGIILHNYCPYNYCLPPTEPVNVDLNIENGSDAQCAFHRHQRICGCCKPGFSLTLGSSECRECSHYSLFLIIPFGLAGIALVVLMMVCNFTLAAGTLNGLLFYANVLIANRASFFPFHNNVLTVFVSWLGLNLGIATCFYNSMEGLGKMWVQISFELYLIVLMIAILLLGRNMKVATLFNKYNLRPVHTLATLVMLSCEKLSRKVFSLMAFTKLEYPNGTSEHVWLINPCVKYIHGGHIPLVIVAILIIITGIIFNFVLLCNKMFVARCRSVYFNSFMEAFYAPFKPNHHYWVGLLLLIRNISYFTSEFYYADENPGYNLHFVFSLIIGLLLIKFFYVSMPSLQCISDAVKSFILRHPQEVDLPIATERDCSDDEEANPEEQNSIQEKTIIHGIVYKSPYLDFLETSFLINLLLLTYFTLYLEEESKKQNILFNISVSVVLVTFVAILIYHVCVYTSFIRVMRGVIMKCRKQPKDGDRLPLVTSNDDHYGTNATATQSELPNPETPI